MIVTRHPRARYASAMFEPMKPAPPVTTTCLVMTPSSRARGALRLFVEQVEQVLAVRAARQMRGQLAQLRVIDEPEVVRDLLGAGDLQPLPQLHRLDEVRRLQQRLLRAGVEPRKAAAELLDAQFAASADRRD